MPVDVVDNASAVTDEPRPGERLRLAIVVASVRPGRFGPTVARWFAEVTWGAGHFEADLIDLADTPLAGAPSSDPDPDTARSLAVLSPRLEAADAFVVVTPEYNHSYPAALKNAIDWHYTQWQAKPVGFVSYGGLAGGLRAVEHLRQVYAELHAVTVRDTVSFHGAAATFTDSGEPVDRTGPQTAAVTMLGQLSWWARALKAARARHPYGTAG